MPNPSRRKSLDARTLALLLNSRPSSAALVSLIIIAGLTLPFPLILLVGFTGHSEILEEIAKALIILVLVLRLPSRSGQLAAGILFGALFGISESFLYLNQIVQLGKLTPFFEHLLFTVPMHTLSAFLIALFGSFGKKYLAIGFVLALLLHFSFNAIAL